MRTPFNRHALWQVAADAVIIALAWYLAWLLRFDQGRPVYYDRYLDWQIILVVVGIKLAVFVALGLLQPLVALRLDARHVVSAARGVGFASLATFLVFTLFELHPARVPTGVWFIDLLLCLAFVAGSRLLARTLIERPAPGGDGRPRQGGDRRRCRRRGQLVVGDAAESLASAPRRSGSSTTTRASATCASTESACSGRRPSCRACSAITVRTRC